MRTIRPAIALVLLLIAVLMIAACGSSAQEAGSPGAVIWRSDWRSSRATRPRCLRAPIFAGRRVTA